jgi:DNA repair protein RadC
MKPYSYQENPMTDINTDINIVINTDVKADDNTDIDVAATTNTDNEADANTEAESGTAPVYRILDLQESERPRERLVKLGPQALTNAELIAILLRIGVTGESAVQVGQRLLSEFRGVRGLHRASIEELIQQHGLGEAKASQIKAAIELGRRITIESLEDRPAINSPSDAASLVEYEMSALEQEHLRVILLDRRNRVMDIAEIYKGSVNSSQVRVGELFREAIRKNASALIVIHNHPSGDPTPSPDDVAVTRAIVQAGKLLDVEVLDHLVIGQGRWVSLKERGLGFA